MQKDNLVKVEIDDIDQKTWSILQSIAKKENKTIDEVASEALAWAVESGKIERLQKIKR